MLKWIDLSAVVVVVVIVVVVVSRGRIGIDSWIEMTWSKWRWK